MMTTTSTTVRKLINVVQARPMAHGTGFKALSIGRNNLGDGVDPFIQLDHYFMSQPTFGPHPHAGFSAVTYMFEDSAGSFANRDSRGDHSLIRPGDLHWTQAGSGIIHDEVPTEPGTVCHGIQMFVNLSAPNKFSEPRAFHLLSKDVPVWKSQTGARVRVLAGSAHGLTSPLQLLTPVTFLDVSVPAHSSIEHEIPVGQNAFVFVIQGQGNFGADAQALSSDDGGLFDREGDVIRIQTGEQPTQYVLCTGQPLNEPMVSQGPFIMNSTEQIQRVVTAYRTGQMGQLN
jgi:redox-sensitive bicupin YhaK (pirin superfamily)